MFQLISSALPKRRLDAGVTYYAELNTQEATEIFKLIERPIYGSSRLGLLVSSYSERSGELEMPIPRRKIAGDLTEVEWIVTTGTMGEQIIEVEPASVPTSYTRQVVTTSMNSRNA